MTLPLTCLQNGYPKRYDGLPEILGFTVVDAPTVLMTHLSEALRKHAQELLSRQDLQLMLEKLKEIAPTTVEEIKPDTVRPALLHQVLVHLLREGIPITSLEKIVESAVHHGPQHKDPIQLTEKIRGDIGHLICDRFRDSTGRVRVIILEPNLEHRFRQKRYCRVDRVETRRVRTSSAVTTRQMGSIAIKERARSGAGRFIYSLRAASDDFPFLARAVHHFLQRSAF